MRDMNRLLNPNRPWFDLMREAKKVGDKSSVRPEQIARICDDEPWFIKEVRKLSQRLATAEQLIERLGAEPDTFGLGEMP